MRSARSRASAAASRSAGKVRSSSPSAAASRRASTVRNSSLRRIVMPVTLDATLRLGKSGLGWALHRGNRHGRSEEARLGVLEAADDLLVEKGFAQLTIEGIAQRAGVAKQTIYRWWSSKTEILMDAFLTDA